MRALHQQTSQASISSFGDTELWVTVSALALPRPQTQKAADIAALAEAAGIFNRQHVRQRRKRAHSMHCLEPSRFRITLRSYGLDLRFHYLQLLGQTLNLLRKF